MGKKKKSNSLPVSQGRKRKLSKTKILETAAGICDKYAEGIYTIAGLCKDYGISYGTFYNWITEDRDGYIEEVQDLYKKAVENSDTNFDLHLKNLARESLLRKVQYQDIEEIQTEGKLDASGKIVVARSVKKTKKTIIPTDNAIIFALTNKDPTNFKNSHSTTALQVTVENKWKNATIEELDAEEARLRAIIEKADKRKLKG